MAKKLTKGDIDRATYQGENPIMKMNGMLCWDSFLLGFGIHIYPSGRKAFILWYRLNINR